MTLLADWLHDNHYTPREIRRILGVNNRSTLHRWLTGERKPNPDMLRDIAVLTGGAVTEADFDSPDIPKCVRLARRADGSTRWVFPWSADAGLEQLHSDRLSSPILRAIQTLNGRARFTPRGRFLLDGRVSDPKRIVEAANSLLRRRGQPVIHYPIVEPIHE